MLHSLLIVGFIYVSLLVFLSYKSRQKTKIKDTQSYFLAGSNLGSILGLFTFAATLFSTFTLIGMPDFFRVHGIGSWIFLAVSDAVMVFGIVVVGVHFRKQALKKGFKGMAGFMTECYGDRRVGYLTFIGSFIFLIPYVAIQIRGIAIFLHAAFPEALSIWMWALLIVFIMLVYSEVGGLKAIIYSDTLQGILLIIVIWVIGFHCLEKLGGIEKMFSQVESTKPQLLSLPGPKNLFSFQFLIASMIAITLIPYTQPQVSTRLVIMKNNQSLFKMAVGVGIFALLIIFPTLLMGMYGAILYPDLATGDFINQVLIQDQTHWIASLGVIGLIAAAISTADSQIFALGGELNSLMTRKAPNQAILISRIAIAGFAIMALAFSLISSDELVLLARTSFAGTALLAPMIFTGIFANHKPSKLIPQLTALSILFFTGTLLQWFPSVIGGIRVDLILLVGLALISLLSSLGSKRHNAMIYK